MRLPILLFVSIPLCIPLFSGHTNAAEPVKGYAGIMGSRNGNSDHLTITYVAAKGPGAEAGIKVGEALAAIDGSPAQGLSPAQAMHLIDGNAGTVVELTLRKSDLTETKVSVVRRPFLETYLPAATEGDPRAQYGLGYFYQFDSNFARDPAKAAEWYQKAADQGYAKAQTNLGYLYWHGFGVPEDQETAASWYLKAAKQGDAGAERNLALSYLHGKGVHQSDQDAFDWFYSASLQNDPTAEYNLGYMYERGLGVAQSNVEALKWYLKAQIGFPKGISLKKNIAIVSLRAFLENRNSASTLDLSLFISAFRKELWCFFIGLVVAYLAGGITLLRFTFYASEAPLRIPVALGWVAFYLESQGVAFLGLCILGAKIGADTLVGVTSLLCALPVIISSCGPIRTRIWRPSPTSWKPLLLVAVGSSLAVALIGFGYERIYPWFVHSTLPPQPTFALLGKTKDSSVVVAYLAIALLLPIAEEIIFRSYLFDALRRYFSGGVVSVATALTFALIHFQLSYFVPLFGFGLILALVRIKTDSLRIPVLLHVINNGLFLLFAL
jgi:membrane protease YdiL (CAAX protease family)